MRWVTSNHQSGKRSVFASSFGILLMLLAVSAIEGQDLSPIQAMEDAREAIRWLRRHANRLGIDPKRIAAYGVSAGGQLAAAAVFDDSATRRTVSSSPDALILFSAAVSLAPDEWVQSLLRQRAKAREISPDEYIRPNLPPTIILQGTADTTTPARGAPQFCDRMKAAGNRCDLHLYEGLEHLLQAPGSNPGAASLAAKSRADAVAQTDRFLVSIGFLSPKADESDSFSWLHESPYARTLRLSMRTPSSSDIQQVPESRRSNPKLLRGLTQAASITGHWEGVITHKGNTLEISVSLEQEPNGLGGTIDIPSLYVSGYKLTSVGYEASKLHFEVSVGSEPDRFDGALNRGRISGICTARLYGKEARSAEFTLVLKNKKPAPYETRDVTVRNGDVSLAGTVFVPLKKGPHPAVVFFQGSGPQTRESYLRFFADLFARHSIVTLIYDKRGAGSSTGEVWERHGDRFDELAADAVAAVDFLKTLKEVDPARIGLWGLSQGGWLAPLAASRSKDVAFLVIVSGGGVTPAEQELYNDEVRLRDTGFSQSQIDDALSLMKLAQELMRGRENWDRFSVAREEARKKGWFATVNRFPLSLPKGHPAWQGGGAGLDFDPGPLWRRTTIPVLAIFGQSDKSTPPQESARRIELSLKAAGNRDYTIRIFPAADHGLLVAPKESSNGDWERPAPGWLEFMTNWLLQRVSGKH